jgi:hypothetical protein
MSARLSIRPTTYRGEPGFLIYGTDAKGHSGISIFTTTRGSAKHIRDLMRDGRECTTADFEPRD